MNKWIALLQSRKFWVNVIGILVAIGVLEFTEGDQERIVEAVLIIVTSLGYSATVAIEDGAQAVARSQEKMAEAQRMVKVQDAIKEYNAQQATQRAERATRR